MSLRYRYNLQSSKSDPPPSGSSKTGRGGQQAHGKAGSPGHLKPVVTVSHPPDPRKGKKPLPPPPQVLVGPKPVVNQTGFQAFTSNEIKRLGRRFRKLDSDKSGTVSLKEFLKIPEISKNVLANRVVEVLDTNRNGEVDFREFVLGMSQFSCVENIEGRLRFAFRIYDIDGNGFISNGELFQVVKCMVGNNLTDIQVQEAVNHTFMYGDTDRDGQISFKEFAALVKNNTGGMQSDLVLRGI